MLTFYFLRCVGKNLKLHKHLQFTNDTMHRSVSSGYRRYKVIELYNVTRKGWQELSNQRKIFISMVNISQKIIETIINDNKIINGKIVKLIELTNLKFFITILEIYDRIVRKLINFFTDLILSVINSCALHHERYKFIESGLHLPIQNRKEIASLVHTKP